MNRTQGFSSETGFQFVLFLRVISSQAAVSAHVLGLRFFSERPFSSKYVHVYLITFFSD